MMLWLRKPKVIDDEVICPRCHRVCRKDANVILCPVCGSVTVLQTIEGVVVVEVPDV